MRRIYFPSSMGQKKLGIDITCKYLYRTFDKKGTIINTLTYTNNTDTNNTNTNNTNNTNKMLSKNLCMLFNENMKTNKPTINIGGDHSMSIATIGASLKKNGSTLKVVWFDAHGDINTSKTSPSGNYHGMPLSFLTGLDTDYKLFPFLYKLPKLKFENILYLGIRDLDDAEKIILKEKKIKFIMSEEINKNPIKTYNKIKDFVGKDPLHFSFDVDGLDPTEMSSTGTTALYGVKTNAIKPIVNKIMNNLNVDNMDITEFNLTIGDQDKSMKNFKKLFEKYLF